MPIYHERKVLFVYLKKILLKQWYTDRYEINIIREKYYFTLRCPPLFRVPALAEADPQESASPDSRLSHTVSPNHTSIPTSFFFFLGDAVAAGYHPPPGARADGSVWGRPYLTFHTMMPTVHPVSCVAIEPGAGGRCRHRTRPAVFAAVTTEAPIEPHPRRW
jgi:hypothetical protein